MTEVNAVGIDVAKGKSTVTVLRPLGELVAKPFNVNHTTSELKKLADFLKSLEGETRVIMEHTGRYHESIAQMLHQSGIYVSAVNPKLIKDYGNNSLRKVKTDKADSKKIARYGLDNWHELKQYILMDTKRTQLKNLNRQYGLYSKTKTALKNNLISLLDQTWPGVNALFDSPARDDGSQKWVDFAYTFWHIDVVRKMTQKSFCERYRKWCKHHHYNFSQAKALEIYRKADDQITLLPKDALTKTLVQQAVIQLNTVSATTAKLKQEMNTLASQLPEYPVIMAMYGVGDTLGPQLMAEIGDVTRFKHHNALTAFAGVDPGANQSNEKENKHNKTSKRGSASLRRTLFLVLDCILKKAPPNEAVFQFMDRKRSVGKPYLVYMTAGANKFLRLYYGKVKEYMRSLPKEE